MKKVQKGFTLVELIVVITILAILGTIAFISLQGYSQDAKNSKVTSDLRTLTSAVETGISDGTVTLSNIVTDTTATVGTANQVGSGSIFYSGALVQTTVGGTNTSTGVTYSVGTVNFAALQQNGDNFKYAVGNVTQPYVIAILADGDVDDNTATNDNYAVYQIAGQLPTSLDAEKQMAITGNFYPLDGSAITGLIAPNGAAPTGATNNQIVTGGGLAY